MDRKNIRYVLKIQFSAPKLLFGNSLEEVVESDCDRVITKLKSTLSSIKIDVKEADIAGATVSGVHFCKNLFLPKDIHMREIQDELGRMDISKVEDVSAKQHKNGGRVLNVYSGTIEYSFYDKISDCMRPKNKRIDKGFMDHEREVVLSHGLQDSEAFRYEYRLKKTQTVRRDINRILDRKPLVPVVFADLFTRGLYRAMILKTWQGIIGLPENQLSLFGEPSRLRVFLHILAEAKKQGGNSGHTLNNGLMAYGLAMAVRDHGAKEVRGAIFDIWNNDHPERFKDKLKISAQLVKGLAQSTNIAFIEAGLERFERINLDLKHYDKR